jgi:hypothetical protein
MRQKLADSVLAFVFMSCVLVLFQRSDGRGSFDGADYLRSESPAPAAEAAVLGVAALARTNPSWLSPTGNRLFTLMASLLMQYFLAARIALRSLSM